MKVWIDAQLSPAIAAWISRNFEDINAESVRSLGLRDALDNEIFNEARNENAVEMSKDDDFIKLIEEKGMPPQFIWITTLRITCAQINVELATNERRDLKPRGAKNWRGASALMRGLGFPTIRFLFSKTLDFFADEE